MNNASQQLGSLIGGYRSTALIGTAARLALADHIAAGSDDVETLAAVTRTRPGRLKQVLRALVALGILTSTAESYRLTPLGEYLRSDHPRTYRSSAVYASRVSLRAFSKLHESLSDSEPAFAIEFGTSFYDAVNTDDELLAAFTGMLDPEPLAIAVANTLDFAGKTVIDVGGGDGVLLSRILRRHPDARGVLFELPDVLAAAGRDVGVDSRLEYLGGDFRTDLLPGGDIYLMARVLANWDDDDVVHILENTRRSMPARARLLIIEMLLPAEVAEGTSAAMGSIDLLVNFGSSMRTELEWAELADRAGLVVDGRDELVVEGMEWSIVAAAPRT